jgi:hypothetical protein
MRMPLVFATISLVLWPQLLFAQTAEIIELSREVIQTERKTIVSGNMNFTDEEGQRFWPVYDNYDSEMREVNHRLVQLVRTYIEKYETMNDKQAEAILREFLDIKTDRVSLKRSYMKQFKRALPQRKLLRFYQLDHKLDSIIDFDLARGVPLAR